MNREFLKKPVPGWVRLGVFILALLYFGFLWPILSGDIFFHTHMPGKSYSGPQEPLTEKERRIKAALYDDVDSLTEKIGEGNLWHYDALQKRAEYIKQRFRNCGYAPESQYYSVEGDKVENISAELKGKNNEILVVGAHYDSVVGTKGANDNGTGVAAVLTLACTLSHTAPAKTIRFVAFVNEEPPFFQTKNMGSLVYAKQCKERKENIVGMISLETMGFYTNKKNSQSYPFPLNYSYPSEGNFIGFAGNNPSSKFLKSAITSFRKNARFPSEGGIIPSIIPGVGWSDHWSFWQEGYPAIMITDTALFRYPFYHKAGDTIDKISFDPYARVVEGLSTVLLGLAKP
jgi:Peptidase family M28